MPKITVESKSKIKNIKRTLVISDIHGCYDAFVKLLKDAQYDGLTDRLILLGDYIDRGTQSYEVVQKIQQLQKKFGKKMVIALRGNHEEMLINLDYYKTNDTKFYPKALGNYNINGGNKTIASYYAHNKTVQVDLKWFKNLPIFFEDENFFFVHAGINPKKSMKNQSANDLLWIREEFIFEPNNLKKTILFGHTPTFFIDEYSQEYKPIRIENKLAIDCGCVYGGKLTAIEITNATVTRFFQVDGVKQPKFVTNATNNTTKIAQ